MKDNLLVTLSILTACTLASAQVTVQSWVFDDANGTNLNVAATAGAEAGSWNFGGPKTQNGSLNLGYTSFYKWDSVDVGAGSVSFRTFTFNDTLTSAAYSTYTFEVNLSKWDLRQNWDANNDSDAAKGVGFRILNAGGDNAQAGFDTQGTSGFRAFSQGTSVGFSQVNGGDFDNALNRFESTGGILRITGDLTTGEWTASANDNDGGTFKTIVSGTGITDIASIGLFSKSPTIGSWGGASAGFTDPVTQGVDATINTNTGDHVLIDSITLTAVAVPEPATYALFTGLLGLGVVLWRRRKLS